MKWSTHYNFDVIFLLFLTKCHSTNWPPLIVFVLKKNVFFKLNFGPTPCTKTVSHSHQQIIKMDKLKCRHKLWGVKLGCVENKMKYLFACYLLCEQKLSTNLMYTIKSYLLKEDLCTLIDSEQNMPKLFILKISIQSECKQIKRVID